MSHIIHLWVFIVFQISSALPTTAMEIENRPTDVYVRQHPYFHNVSRDEGENIITNSKRGNVLFCNANTQDEFLIVYAIVLQRHHISSLTLTCNEDLGTITRQGFGECHTLSETLSTLQKWLQGFAQFVPNPIINPKLHESWSKFGTLEEAIQQDHERRMNLASIHQQKKEALCKNYINK